MNEELQTVNSQLEVKVGEMETTNHDIHNLLANIDHVVLFLDLRLRIKHFTPAAAHLLRVVDTDIGRPFSDIAKTIADDQLLRDTELVLNQLTPIEKTIRDSQQRCHLRRIIPYRSKEDRVDGVVITYVDITDRMHSEDARRHLAAIVESSDDAIFSSTLDGVVTSWSRGAESLYGYTADEMIGRQSARLVPPDRPDEFPGILELWQRGERIDRLETVRVHKDGSLRDVALTLLPMRDFQGQIVGVSTLARDITDRKQAEADLAVLNRQLRQLADERTAYTDRLLEKSPDAVVMINRRGEIMRVNETLETMFGYERDELLGRPVETLLPEGIRARHLALRDAYFAEPRMRAMGLGMSLSARRNDGQVFPVEIQLTPLILDGETVAAASIRDMTERQRLEQELAERTDSERQQLGRELHDTIGQDCSAIGMLVSTLKQQAADSPIRADILDRLDQCVEAAKRQLRRFRKGLLPVDLDAEGLDLALDELAEGTRQLHDVDCRFESAIPILMEDNLVATQLYLIVREAVHNAVKHSQAKHIVIRVEEANGLRVSIRDDGVGLQQATMDDAAGMGLRIMRYRCGLIGARITFESPERGGTIVAIFLPEGGHQRMMRHS